VLDGNHGGVSNDPIVVLNTMGAVKLTLGNHQAHKEITRGPGSVGGAGVK